MTEQNTGVQLNPNAIPLGNDTDSLVGEWKKLNAALAKTNEKIKQSRQLIDMGNNTIEEANNEGRLIIGQLDILARIFVGMGVDPNNLPGSEAKNIEKIPTKLTPADANMQQFVGNKEVNPNPVQNKLTKFKKKS